MKTLYTLLSILCIAHTSISFARQTQDTTFLLREIKDGVYHSIFIDTCKASKFYDEISNFNIDSCCKKSYNNSLVSFRKKRNTTIAKKSDQDNAEEMDCAVSV